MNYRELNIFAEGLKEVSNLRGVNFALAVARNVKIVEAELSTFREAIPKPSKEFLKFEETANKMREEFESSKVEERKSELNEEFKKLQLDNKEIIEKRNSEVNEYLDTEIDLNLVKISAEDLPKDVSAEMLYKISYMLND